MDRVRELVAFQMQQIELKDQMIRSSRENLTGPNLELEEIERNKRMMYPNRGYGYPNHNNNNIFNGYSDMYSPPPIGGSYEYLASPPPPPSHSNLGRSSSFTQFDRVGYGGGRYVERSASVGMPHGERGKYYGKLEIETSSYPKGHGSVGDDEPKSSPSSNSEVAQATGNSTQDEAPSNEELPSTDPVKERNFDLQERPESSLSHASNKVTGDSIPDPRPPSQPALSRRSSLGAMSDRSTVTVGDDDQQSVTSSRSRSRRHDGEQRRVYDRSKYQRPWGMSMARTDTAYYNDPRNYADYRRPYYDHPPPPPPHPPHPHYMGGGGGYHGYNPVMRSSSFGGPHYYDRPSYRERAYYDQNYEPYTNPVSRSSSFEGGVGGTYEGSYNSLPRTHAPMSNHVTRSSSFNAFGGYDKSQYPLHSRPRDRPHSSSSHTGAEDTHRPYHSSLGRSASFQGLYDRPRSHHGGSHGSLYSPPPIGSVLSGTSEQRTEAEPGSTRQNTESSALSANGLTGSHPMLYSPPPTDTMPPLSPTLSVQSFASMPPNLEGR